MILKDLIKEKRRSKGLTQQALADLLNTEKGVISNWESGRRSPSLENMTTLSKFFDIDFNELLQAGKPNVKYQSPNFKPSVANESIALYSLNVEAGFDTGLENSPDYIEGYIQMPGIGKNDGSWVVSGHSMYPTISKGSRVVLRKVEDWNLIEWNNVYVVDLKEMGPKVKRVKKGINKEHYTLVSDNKDFEPMDIDKKDIKAIFRVLIAFEIF